LLILTFRSLATHLKKVYSTPKRKKSNIVDSDEGKLNLTIETTNEDLPHPGAKPYRDTDKTDEQKAANLEWIRKQTQEYNQFQFTGPTPGSLLPVNYRSLATGSYSVGILPTVYD
jgi:hypothetical protein